MTHIMNWACLLVNWLVVRTMVRRQKDWMSFRNMSRAIETACSYHGNFFKPNLVLKGVVMNLQCWPVLSFLLTSRLLDFVRLNSMAHFFSKFKRFLNQSWGPIQQEGFMYTICPIAEIHWQSDQLVVDLSFMHACAVELVFILSQQIPSAVLLAYIDSSAITHSYQFAEWYVK
jgi:hypothetical protein